MKNIRLLLFLVLVLPSVGFIWSNETPEEGGPKVPANLPQPNIQEGPFYDKLLQSYGDSLLHEQVKIEFLIDQIEVSPYSYIRNGIVFNSKLTAFHLRNKLKSKVDAIKTAREFVDHIASESSTTGKPYLVKPGDGLVYYSKDVLDLALEKLEAYIELHIKDYNPNEGKKDQSA